MWATELNLLHSNVFPVTINHRKSRRDRNLCKKTSSAKADVWHSFHEVVHGASVWVATFDVVLLPVDVVDLAGDVSADDVVLFDLVKRQVGVVDTNQNHSGVGSTVQQDFIVDLRYWNLPGLSINIQVDVVSNIVQILKLSYAECAGVNIQRNSTVGGQNPKDDIVMLTIRFRISFLISTYLEPSSTATQFSALNFCH